MLLLIALVAPGAAPGPKYVGSKLCYGCHAEISKSFARTDMGRSIQLASSLTESDAPAQSVIPASDGRFVRAFREGPDWFQSEEQPNIFVDKQKLDYIVGSGANGFTPLVRRGQELFQAPLSFYSKPGKWDWSPGYEHADLAFGRPIAHECISCHSGHPTFLPGRQDVYADPPFQELAIGCENCHGPGESHVREPARHGMIINPAKLSPRLAENICMNCHQGGDARIVQPGKQYSDFHPGQWLIETVAIFKVPPQPTLTDKSDLLEHDSAMRMSRCFVASQGKLSCFTCHDPHVQPRPNEAAAYFRQKCFTCHSDTSCKLPLKSRLEGAHPDSCISCHMPKRAVAAISHSALTNHRIPSSANEPLPAAKVRSGRDLILLNAPPGENVNLPEITLLRAYSELAGRDPEYQRRYLELLDLLAKVQPDQPFVQAALGHKLFAEGKYKEALMHLSGAVGLDEVTIQQDMADALSKLGRGAEAVACLERACQEHPFNNVLLKTLTLEYIHLKRYGDARRTMQQYVDLFPEDQFMRGLLARVAN